MAGGIGRQAIISAGGSVLAGIRTKTLSYAGTSVDISSGEDDGYRLLLAESGRKTVDISIEGVEKDGVLRDLTLGGGDVMFEDFELEWYLNDPVNTTKAKITGTFRLESYEEGQPYEEEVTFSGNLVSSGAWTYTPEAA